MGCHQHPILSSFVTGVLSTMLLEHAAGLTGKKESTLKAFATFKIDCPMFAELRENSNICIGNFLSFGWGGALKSLQTASAAMKLRQAMGKKLWQA